MRLIGIVGVATLPSAAASWMPLSDPLSYVGAKHPPLRPAAITVAPIFTDFKNSSTVLPDGTPTAVAEGRITYPPPMPTMYDTRFVVLPGLAKREEVEQMLSLINVSNGDTGVVFDTDPDSIDGMSSHEFYLFSDEQNDGVEPNTLKGDFDETQLSARAPVRKALHDIVDPIVEQRIIPFIRQHYPSSCNSSASRACRVCSAVFRKYLPNSRRSCSPHQDHEAIVTAIINLSDYGIEYNGGLYVSAGSNSRHTVALNRGDVLVHATDLQHGVTLGDEWSERWSLILWIRDSATCAKHNAEWHQSCSDAGNPVCQYLLAMSSRDPTKPTTEKNDTEIMATLQLMYSSAMAGHGPALMQMGVAAKMFQRLEEAQNYLRAALEKFGDARAAYSLARMLLDGTAGSLTGAAAQAEAVKLFELAALDGHESAAYSLGVAHLLGYGVPMRDPELAVEWFKKSGMPEGLHMVSMYHKEGGRLEEAERWDAQAKRLGLGMPWRPAAMKRSGIDTDLHEMWNGAGTREDASTQPKGRTGKGRSGSAASDL